MNINHTEPTLSIPGRFRSCLWLPLLFIFSFTQAVCMPQDTVRTASANQSTEKIYLHGNARIVVADDTFIAGAEIVRVRPSSNPKAQPKKKPHPQKPKLIIREARLQQKLKPQPKPEEFIHSTDPLQKIGAGDTHARLISTTSQTSHRMAATIVAKIALQMIGPALPQKIDADHDHIQKRYFSGPLFQRPPPAFI